MTEKETLEFLRNEQLLMRIGVIDADGYPLAHPVCFCGIQARWKELLQSK